MHHLYDQVSLLFVFGSKSGNSTIFATLLTRLNQFSRLGLSPTAMNLLKQTTSPPDSHNELEFFAGFLKIQILNSQHFKFYLIEMHFYENGILLFPAINVGSHFVFWWVQDFPSTSNRHFPTTTTSKQSGR